MTLLEELVALLRMFSWPPFDPTLLLFPFSYPGLRSFLNGVPLRLAVGEPTGSRSNWIAENGMV